MSTRACLDVIKFANFLLAVPNLFLAIKAYKHEVVYRSLDFVLKMISTTRVIIALSYTLIFFTVTNLVLATTVPELALCLLVGVTWIITLIFQHGHMSQLKKIRRSAS